MTPTLWWFGFHPPDTILGAIRKRQWTMFGHVEAWGWCEDDTFIFFDPRAAGTKLMILRDPDAIDNAFGARLLACQSVLRLPAPDTTIRLPIHPAMNCVSQCAHLIGLRAYRPSTLHRILRALGAKELQDDAQDRPERAGSTGSRTPAGRA